MKKRLLAILLTVCMVISMAPAALAAGTNPFTDVSVDDWYYDEVQYVYENDLMKGTSTTTFSPDVTVNRAMMVTILYRLEGAPAVSTTGSFTDVSAEQYYADAVEWAKENEITAGYGNGMFGPNDLLTREQMATFFYRYAEFKGYDVSASADLSDYTDLATVGSYAIDAFKWTNANGLIKGTTTTTLSPKGDATRGQLAVILHRFCENIVADAVETHTVTFDYNYSNKGTYTTMSVKDGDKVEKPNNPTRSSYSFSGWYTKASGGSKFDFNAAVTADLTLYARWSYNGGGGGGSSHSHSHSWTAGTPVAPTCTEQGYTPYTCACGASKNDDFVPAVSHVAGEKCQYCGVIEVKTAEQLIAAAAGEGEVKIKMIANIAIDVAAWQNNALGGASTTSIVIDGDNGDVDYTLTFNQTNSDWNNVVTKNDAKLVLKNMNITNSGHNDGPWNRHDINFGCDVEMENVNSDKALAFKADADLTKVTIDDANTSDTYAIWIQSNGQTVTLNGCTIDMMDATDGRGIKIDEEYVNAPAKVTLSVSNTTFKTEEKSAILVKSKAGANITLSEVDISGVAADSFNEVWVDEDSASYYDLVTVTGGDKILEGTTFVAVMTADDLVSAFANLKAGGIISIENDIDMTGKTITPVTGNVGFTMRGNGNTISNLSTTAAALFVDHSGSSSYTFEDVVLEECSVNSATNYGALFVGDGDTSDAITITNCHVKNCNVTSAKYAAAFVGYTAGYNVQDNGPVYSDVTIENCSVTGGSIIGGGSVGAAIGHAGGNVDTTNIITNFTVSGLAINGEDAEHTGIVVGTAHVGETIISNATYTDVSGNYNTTTKIYGRFLPGTTGKLLIDGGMVVTTADELAAALSAGVSEIALLADTTYRMPSNRHFTTIATISGPESAVLDMTWGAYWDEATLSFEGITIETGTGYVTSNGTSFGSDYAALYSPNVTYTDCTFVGPMRVGRDGAKFVNCTFTELGNDYIWTYGNEVSFEDCTFNTAGKAILIYSDGNGDVPAVVVKDCVFNSTQGAKAGAIANQNCAAIEIHNYGCGVTLTTSDNMYDSDFSGEWRIKTYENISGNTVTVNGVEYTTIAIDGKTMTIDSNKNVTVSE